MWKYQFPSGQAVYIVPYKGEYQITFEDTMYCGCRTPEAAADDAANRATGCYELDELIAADPEFPLDLSGWVFLR